MGAQPSKVYEVDVDKNIGKVYNPLFPTMIVEAPLELFQDFKAMSAPGHGSEDFDIEQGVTEWLRDEYKAKYGI